MENNTIETLCNQAGYTDETFIRGAKFGSLLAAGVLLNEVESVCVSVACQADEEMREAVKRAIHNTAEEQRRNNPHMSIVK